MDKINEKLSNVTKYITDKLSKNYDLALNFNEDFFVGVYEIDSITREIYYCLLFDLWQASITLTNHLLEKSLKLLLIYNDSGKKQLKNLSKVNELYGHQSNEYNSKVLEYTINKACSIDLITKEEKKVLHIYRERLRNGFSHSDMGKIFKNSISPLVMGSFKTPDKLEIGEAKLSEVPFLQGIAQEKFAEGEALEYYKFVYSIIKKNINILK